MSQENLIIETGRDMAVELFEAAINHAPSVQDVKMGVSVLQVAAIHVLATIVYNKTLEKNAEPIENNYTKVLNSIKKELEYIRDTPENHVKVTVTNDNDTKH